jgi:hypothetical protein
VLAGIRKLDMSLSYGSETMVPSPKSLQRNCQGVQLVGCHVVAVFIFSTITYYDAASEQPTVDMFLPDRAKATSK